MSKVWLLRSRLKDPDLCDYIDRKFLRPHDLDLIRTDACVNRVFMLGELETIIRYSQNLCHPWQHAPWDWEDPQCIQYFGNICFHFYDVSVE